MSQPAQVRVRTISGNTGLSQTSQPKHQVCYQDSHVADDSQTGGKNYARRWTFRRVARKQRWFDIAVRAHTVSHLWKWQRRACIVQRLKKRRITRSAMAREVVAITDMTDTEIIISLVRYILWMEGTVKMHAICMSNYFYNALDVLCA